MAVPRTLWVALGFAAAAVAPAWVLGLNSYRGPRFSYEACVDRREGLGL